MKYRLPLLLALTAWLTVWGSPIAAPAATPSAIGSATPSAAASSNTPSASAVPATPTPGPTTIPPATTVVSLTFDDGYASQWMSRDVLLSHHMHATFYVNSDRIGTSERMSLSQIQALQDDGNEIGGHTADHVNLPTLNQNEQAREICDDRATLIRDGLRVASFAYPYGAYTKASERIVEQCGYDSARTVGGLDPTTASCRGCPYADATPVPDPYAVSAEDSVVTATSVTQIEAHIARAIAHGGGWVPLVLHEVCDDCSDIAISPAHLSRLLDWISTQERNGVIVRTVAQVMGGAVRPVVVGPPDTRPFGVLTNADLSVASPSDGASGAAAGGTSIPSTQTYCWQQAGYGVNSATWARVPNAYGHDWGVQLSVSRYFSGDAKLLIALDTGTCAPRVRSGARYTLSAWYKSSERTRIVVFYRASVGAWRYWKSSKPMPASSTWRLATFTTPPLPQGAIMLSYGLPLAGVGSITTAHYGMAKSDSVVRQVVVWSVGAALGVLVVLVLLYARRRRARSKARGASGRSSHRAGAMAELL